MYKLCLLVACLACAGNARRLNKARLQKHLNSQDMKEQMGSSAASMSHGQANQSVSGQLPKSTGKPGKFISILLAFCSPASVFAPSSNIFSLNSSIHDNTQIPSWKNLSVGHAGPHAMMKDQTDVEETLPEFGGPTVRAVISVDWEGLNLEKENLRALKHFHQVHPKVPLTHFLNAAYLVKTDSYSILHWSPYQALRPIDEPALQVNGLKSLVEASGVKYRSEGNFMEGPEELKEWLDDEEEMRDLVKDYPEWVSASKRIEVLDYLHRDVGEHIDIRTYSVEELQSIISTAKALLQKHGLKVGKSFRAGAWLAGPNVREAIRREGFLVNSSAVNFDEMIRKYDQNNSSTGETPYRDIPLAAMLRELWPGITSESQPFLLETPVGWILEMPDTGGKADFASVKDMVEHIDSAVQQLDSEDRFVHLGFHQESAAIAIGSVIAAITEIKRKHGHRVVFETLEASAQRARSTQRLKEMEAKNERDALQKW